MGVVVVKGRFHHEDHPLELMWLLNQDNKFIFVEIWDPQCQVNWLQVENVQHLLGCQQNVASLQPDCSPSGYHITAVLIPIAKFRNINGSYMWNWGCEKYVWYDDNENVFHLGQCVPPTRTTDFWWINKRGASQVSSNCSVILAIAVSK